MTHRRILITGLVLGALAGPVAGASASAGSIKAAVRSYSSRIDVAEGDVLTAIGTYKTSHVAAPVEEAIAKSETVLSGLRAKVARQPAARPRVKKARSLIVKGLGTLIFSYGKLKTAYSLDASNTEAAKAEATKALAAVKAGRKELLTGVKLLG